MIIYFTLPEDNNLFSYYHPVILILPWELIKFQVCNSKKSSRTHIPLIIYHSEKIIVERLHRLEDFPGDNRGIVGDESQQTAGGMAVKVTHQCAHVFRAYS